MLLGLSDLTAINDESVNQIISICFLLLWNHNLSYSQENRLYGTYQDAMFQMVLHLDTGNRFQFIVPPGPLIYAKDTVLVVGNWIMDGSDVVLNSDIQPTMCNHLYYLELLNEELSKDFLLLHVRTIKERLDGVKIELDRTPQVVAIEVNNNGDQVWVDNVSGELTIPRKGLEQIIVRFPYMDCPRYFLKSPQSNYLEIIHDETGESGGEAFLWYQYFADEHIVVDDHEGTLVLDGDIVFKKVK